MSTQKRSLSEIIAAKRLEQKNREAEGACSTLPSPIIQPNQPNQPIQPIQSSNSSNSSNPDNPSNPTTPTSAEVLLKLSLSQILRRKQASIPTPTEYPTYRDKDALTPEAEARKEAGKLVVDATVADILAQRIPTKATDATDATEKAEATDAYKGAFSLDITLNSKQLLAKELAFAGKSFCLVGAAGTGKTTAQREVAAALLATGSLRTHSFKIQGTAERVEAPSIAFVAYTRVASGNLRRAIHKLPALEEAFRHNVTTIHNLLEYTPETYWNYEENREAFRFTPKRTASNPLDITHLIIEEASMVGLDLWEKLYAALRPDTQVIFIGDINQLPPVFGDAILNYALVQLPVIELTEVYRQREDSAILENAHRILKGEQIVEAPDFRVVRGGTTNYTQAKLATSLGMTFPKWAKLGEYDPIQDIILSPWNKRDLGTDNMNKWIAQFLGSERGAVVHEVLAGMNKLYLAEGDKVMYNKQVGIITRISVNGRYMGRSPIPASINLNRFGTYTGLEEETADDLDSIDYSHLDLDKMLEDSEGDRTKEASHITDILLDDGMEVTLQATGDYAPASFSLAYALTIHKAQGCEWRKVYLILHRDHAVSLCREALYTGVTRAREQLVLIAKDDVIAKAIATQRIKGNTTAEKIEYFNSGIKLNNAVHCMK